MKINEIVKKIITEQQYLIIRERKNEAGEYDIKEDCGTKKGWVYIDGVTANLINKIYNALSEERREKYISLPLSRLIDVSWKMVK
jgi:hypothetical protein